MLTTILSLQIADVEIAEGNAYGQAFWPAPRLPDSLPKGRKVLPPKARLRY